MSYGPSLPAMWEQESLVATVLKGAQPSELPVEQPTKFELVINVGVTVDLIVKLLTSW